MKGIQIIKKAHAEFMEMREHIVSEGVSIYRSPEDTLFEVEL